MFSYIGNNVSIDLGKVDAVLSEMRSWARHLSDRVYQSICDRCKIYFQRTEYLYPSLSGTGKRLFEAEVAEVRDGIVEIKSIAREAAVQRCRQYGSNDPTLIR